MRNSARNMMNCGRNISNGSRQAVSNNRISIGKTGQPPRTLALATRQRRARPICQPRRSGRPLWEANSPYSDFFTNIFGQARKSGSGRSAPPSPRRGRDVEYEVDLTLEEAFHGADRSLEMDGHRITGRYSSWVCALDHGSVSTGQGRGRVRMAAPPEICI